MNELQLLALALGVSALAGINLYLTVLMTGLVMRFQWLELPPELVSLAVLGHPAVIGVAGILFLVEFVADKVPWVDSLWDAVHTVIRPLGAAWLSFGLAANGDPAFAVVAALLGGGVALTTHSGKAGVRLLANASPEPVSNSVLSVTEDLVVLGGLYLIVQYPWVAAGVALVLVLLVIWLVPKVVRVVLMHVRLVKRTLLGVPPPESPSLPLAWREKLDGQLGAGEALQSAEPAFALAVRGVPVGGEGAVVRVGDRLGWVDGKRAALLPVAGLECHLKKKGWFEEVSWFSPKERSGMSVRVPRGRGEGLVHGSVANMRVAAVEQT